TEVSPQTVTKGTRRCVSAELGGELRARLAEIILGNDRVAAVHGLGLLTCELRAGHLQGRRLLPRSPRAPGSPAPPGAGIARASAEASSSKKRSMAEASAPGGGA